MSDEQRFRDADNIDIRKAALHEAVLLERVCIRMGKPESRTREILRVADEFAAWLRKGAEE